MSDGKLDKAGAASANYKARPAFFADMSTISARHLYLSLLVVFRFRVFRVPGLALQVSIGSSNRISGLNPICCSYRLDPQYLCSSGRYLLLNN